MGSRICSINTYNESCRYFEIKKISFRQIRRYRIFTHRNKKHADSDQSNNERNKHVDNSSNMKKKENIKKKARKEFGNQQMEI